MPKKGDSARETVKNTIIEAFNATGNFVAFQDKKIYVTAKDGPAGEVLQFAITMTMPKVPVEVGAQTTVSTNALEGSAGPVQNVVQTPVEISPEDKEQVARLKEMLGIKT